MKENKEIALYNNKGLVIGYALQVWTEGENGIFNLTDEKEYTSKI